MVFSSIVRTTNGGLPSAHEVLTAIFRLKS
jgi:hypothetical protein